MILMVGFRNCTHWRTSKSVNEDKLLIFKERFRNCPHALQMHFRNCTDLYFGIALISISEFHSFKK